jgi:hypothetical protein
MAKKKKYKKASGNKASYTGGARSMKDKIATPKRKAGKSKITKSGK